MGAIIDISKELCEQFDAVSALVEDANRIALCAHTNPDGDAVGSVLGLATILQIRWPGKDVQCLLADPTPIPRVYEFLAGSDSFLHVDEYEGDPDLFICVDMPSPDRLNEVEPIMRRSGRVAVMDHHPRRGEDFADVHIGRPDSAAAGVVVAEYGIHLGIEFTPALAQSLFCAIVTDTGRFQFQNTDGEVLEVASLLVDAGATPSVISLEVYQSDRLEYVHLEAIVMGRITTFCDGRIAYSYATMDDLRATGVSYDECDGLVDLVRSVAGVEVVLLLKESPEGLIRGNLRAKGDQDVSVVAQAFGGGGHRAASGFTCEGPIRDVFERAMPLLEAALVED